jgi:hypothetical protein
VTEDNRRGEPRTREKVSLSRINLERNTHVQESNASQTPCIAILISTSKNLWFFLLLLILFFNKIRDKSKKKRINERMSLNLGQKKKRVS